MNPAILLCGLLLGQVAEPPEDPATEALVERIRENLLAIDDLLFETADASDPAAGLRATRETHMNVIRDLEELIQQAKYRRSQGGGGGSESPPPQGEPPPARPSDGSQSPEQQGGSQPQSPQEGGAEGAQGTQGEQGEQPADAEPSGGLGRNEFADQPPPPDELGDFTREDADGRWGLLPPKLQERLVNLHVDDVPERYRRWLEAYIRSMNRLEQEQRGGR